jgi:integrase
MANTGLRPDEALRLQFRDVEVEPEQAKNGRGDILVIKVRGKRGVGYCKSMPGAVEPFRRLEKRPRPTKMSGDLRSLSTIGGANAEPASGTGLPKPNDLIFSKTHRELFREILHELNLKTDREGNERTAYSLRHTYISLRLMERADIYQIAKNCRTSVEMIEKYYAAHIKDSIDADAINVKTRRKAKRLPRELS